MITTQEQTVRRQDVARTYVYPRIPTSLMNQVDQVVASATELDMPKYTSRNHFIESAVRELIFKERRKPA